MSNHLDDCKSCSRRDFLSSSAAALGAAAFLPSFLQETNLAFAANAVAGVQNAHPERILVVLEMSGGNDGLNTVVPYTNDEYYRVRPTLGIKEDKVLKISDEFGFHPSLLGWERLFKDGHMAVVHGCSYPNATRSHFESMRFWHTGVPNAAETYGWLGRLADTRDPQGTDSYIVNVASQQSPAVVSAKHSAVVFDDPARFRRAGTAEQSELFQEVVRQRELSGNSNLDFVRSIGSVAETSSDFIRNACAEFRSKASYGYGAVGPKLQNIVAQIGADSPARIYYTSFGSFDHHAGQAESHVDMLNRAGDSVLAFYRDLEAIGRADQVTLMMFSEFGRRVKENAGRGTDHGVAGPMFVIGKQVQGGLYGEHPSLTDLDEAQGGGAGWGGDLKMTTDFRHVYATMTKEWLGVDDTKSVLKADFPTLGMFA